MKTCLCGLWISLVLAPSATSQTLPEQGRDPKKDAIVLKERERELMHPGRPLDLIGNEQEGNVFRDRRPGLAHVEKMAVAVDVDENYARRLAMYNQGSRFATPVAANRGVSNASGYRDPRGGSNSAARPPVTQPLDGPAPANRFQPAWWAMAATALCISAVRAVRARTGSTRQTA